MMESILQANLVPLGLSPSESGFLGKGDTHMPAISKK